MQIKLDLEKIFLVLFFGVFLLLGNGFLSDHRLQHGYPYAYLASDAFQHQTRAQGIKDAGNYINEPSYIVMGVQNAVGYYPPVLYHLSVTLSYLSGLEVYDTIYFLVFFFAAIASLVMYFIIKNFNRNVALISLPFSFLVFYGGLYTGFAWGHWPTIVSQFFLICVFWYSSRTDLGKSYIFLGIFIAATFMTHTSETVYAALYLILFFIVSSVINKKIEINLIKNFSLGAIIALIITFYYLVIFKYVWGVRQTFEFAVSKTWDNPTMYLSDFKLILLLMAAGMVFAAMSITQIRQSAKGESAELKIDGLKSDESYHQFLIRKSLVPALAALSMMVIGNGNYFGFREKAFQLRFLWPVFLSFFIGFGIYQLLKLVIKEWKVWYSVVLSIIITIVIISPSIPLMPHYSLLESSGLMDQFHWESFNWLAKNTEKDAKIYFFYGDIYSQDALLRNSKRMHYQITPEGIVDAIQKKEIRRIYDSELPGDGGGGGPYRKSFFSFGFGIDELPKEVRGPKQDICRFNYLVFDRVSQQPVLAQYNLIVASELAKKDYIKPVFENNYVVILKNNNPGADCIEQRNF